MNQNTSISNTLANDPNTSPKVLDELSHHKSLTIRQLVAKNPNTPSYALERIILIPCIDYWDSVHWSVIANPSASSELKLYSYYDYAEFYMLFGDGYELFWSY